MYGEALHLIKEKLMINGCQPKRAIKIAVSRKKETQDDLNDKLIKQENKFYGSNFTVFDSTITTRL